MLRSGHDLTDAIAGRRVVSLVDSRLPGRPLADAPAAFLAVVDDGAALGFVAPEIVQQRRTAAGLVTTVHCGDNPVEILCQGHEATEVLAASRIRRAAWLSGLAAGCLALTVQRARTREQFGRPLIANQDVAFRLARLKIRHDAVAALIGELAGQLDDGVVDTALVAGALAEAGTLALATTREAVQLHGVFGMTAASPVGRHYLAAPLAIAGDAAPAVLYVEAGVR